MLNLLAKTEEAIEKYLRGVIFKEYFHHMVHTCRKKSLKIPKG